MKKALKLGFMALALSLSIAACSEKKADSSADSTMSDSSMTDTMMKDSMTTDTMVKDSSGKM